MEYALFAACLTALSVFIAGYWIARRCRSYGFRGGSRIHVGIETPRIKKGILSFYPLADLLLQRSSLASAFEFFSSNLKLYGIVIDARALASYFVLIEVLLALITLIVSQSLVISLLIVALTLPLIGVYKEHVEEKLMRDLEREIPHFYKSLRNAFLAGQSIEQALRMQLVSKHHALRTYVQRVVNKLDMGYPLEFALDELKESRNASLIYMTLILEVQHKMGSSVLQIFNEAIRCAQEKLDLQNSLKVQTAQARFSSRVVSALPLLITLSFALISPNFMKSYFSSFAGISIFACALVLQAAGVYIVRSLIKKEQLP